MYRRLLKDSALYTLSALLVRGLGFLLLPLYVRVLSRRDFGLYDYVTVLGFVVGVLVALEVAQGLTRFVADRAREDEHDSFVATAAGITLVSYSLFVVVVASRRNWIAGVVLGDVGSGQLVVQIALLYMAIAFVYLWVTVARALMRPLLSLAFSLSSAGLSGGLGLLFAVVTSQPLEGLIFGQLLGQAVVAWLGVAVYRRKLVAGFDRNSALRLLRFSGPLVISSVAVTLSLYVDRIFVRQMLGLEQLAVYAVAARLAGVVTLLTVGLQSALTPLIYSEADKPATPTRLAWLFRWYVALGASIVVLLAALGGPIVELIAGEGFDAAVFPFVVLALAVLVQGACLFFPGLYIAGRTGTLAVIHVFAIGVNVALNVVLIKVWELTGAAFATLFGAFVVLGLNYWHSQRHYPVRVGAPMAD